MSGGRPSKLTPAVIETARHYVDHYDEYGDVIPSLVGLAYALNVSESTINLWKTKEGTEFSEIASKLHSNQARALLNGGLSGEYNASISKLILTKHGYSDKQELSGNDGKDLIAPVFRVIHE